MTPDGVLRRGNGIGFNAGDPDSGNGMECSSKPIDELDSR